MRKKISVLLFLLVFILSFGKIKVENSKELVTGKLTNGMTYFIFINIICQKIECLLM